MKYRLRNSMLIGVAYQRPMTNAYELGSQFIVQPEFKLGRLPTELLV